MLGPLPVEPLEIGGRFFKQTRYDRYNPPSTTCSELGWARRSRIET